MSPFGKSLATKTDEFSEMFQTAFDLPPLFRKITLQIFGDRLTSACFGTIFNTCCGVGNIHLPKSIFSLETNQPVKGRLGNHPYVSLWSYLDFDFLEWYTWHQEQRRGGGSTPQERATADFAAAAVGKWEMHARCRSRWWEAEDFKAFPPSLLALAKSTLTPYSQPSHCVQKKKFSETWILNLGPGSLECRNRFASRCFKGEQKVNSDGDWDSCHVYFFQPRVAQEGGVELIRLKMSDDSNLRIPLCFH